MLKSPIIKEIQLIVWNQNRPQPQQLKGWGLLGEGKVKATKVLFHWGKGWKYGDRAGGRESNFSWGKHLVSYFQIVVEKYVFVS